jgi:8-oxo-dGTP pyrophosphatase MutT (NUDIX family)
MRRKYEIHIDGRPVVIIGSDEVPVAATNWLTLRVDDPREVWPAVKQFEQRTELAGLLLHSSDVPRSWKEFRGRYTFVQAAGGAVTDEQGRLLAIHRLGRWDLPKGKVEKGEEIPAAAVREVQEECGLVRVTLDAPLCDTWHTYERKGELHLKRTDWFLMRASSTEKLVPQADEDISEVRWLDAAAVRRMKAETYPSLISVLEAWEQALRSRT